MDGFEELTEASYNTVYRIRTNGQGRILKVAPDPTAPGLAHEHDLIRTEAMFYTQAKGRIPVPEVIHADDEHLLMTELPGHNWFGRDEPNHAELRRELGAIVAKLHTIEGETFGYPQQPPKATWREAFTGMLEDVLNDAERYGVDLPEIKDSLGKNAHLLDAIRKPVLVHFDLWPGNILIHDNRISGLVDGERAFWGDPAAEFVSLSLFGDIEDDKDFLEGYGNPEFTVDTRRRIALYRTYLYLIMIVETVPRGYEGDHHAQVMALTRRLLDEQLQRLR
ncbi:aminoglycoside phosphotransferase family protein [Actinocrispum sp. NPDC049592]|uniref:phosphotransferase family protein n=1 Tax=Actinocrispum sp. NPDC049592 TaxID=3154835 RepID=UPI00342F70D4